MKYGFLAMAAITLCACQPTSDDTSGHAGSQTATNEPALTIERAFASPGLAGARPRSLTFSPDGTRVTFLRAKEEDQSVLDLWAMDVDGGEPYRLVDARVLAPEEQELSEAARQLRERARISQSGIVSYDWDSQGEAILVPLDGDVFRVDVESGEARRLMETPEYETDARISPQGNFVSFVREQNLYTIDLETGEETALTTEGGDTVSWGMAEFVAQEELGRRTGYWWSPDERFIAIARVDESRVDNIERMEIATDGSAQVVGQRYPRAGTDNAVVELFILDRETGDRRQVELAATDDIYLARVNWARDSGAAYVQVLNRLQNELTILSVDPATAEGSEWLVEQTDIWINLSNDFRPLDDGTVLLTSEDTPGGYRHIHHRGADGRLIARVTSGNWVVNEIDRVDTENGLVYFTGWTETPLERHIYSAPLDGSAEPSRITEGDGRWSATFASDAETFIGSYSDSDTPSQTALYTANGERIRWIEENAVAEGHPYFDYAGDHIVPEFGTLTAADGTTLHYQLYLPADFDPDRQYPAVQYVYGGPHSQQVHRGWQGVRPQLFAQRGYVYFTIDNRGAANRGRDFESHIQRRMGSVEVEDQLVGLEHLKSLPFVDGDRVGIWGWSYGGYMTLMTTLQAPGAYAAGVSGAPVTDWALYDTAYTERYMDHPDNNSGGYETSSVFAHLENYETPLLLIHGMADDNVIFANSVRLYSEMQERRYPFEMMTYPGQRHGVRGEERQVHLWHTIFDYFDRRLKDGD